MILMDTDVCVEILRGNRKVIAHRRGVSDKVAIASMTMGELFYGAARSSKPAENRQLVEQFLLSVPCIQSDRSIMDKFGSLKADLAARGEMLPDADLLVAATALTRCDALVSGNAAHFARFTGLRVMDWTR